MRAKRRVAYMQAACKYDFDFIHVYIFVQERRECEGGENRYERRSDRMVELLLRDRRETMLMSTTDDSDRPLLDRLAEPTESDVPDFERVRGLYESEPRLKVGATIHSFVQGETRIVEL